MCALVKEVLKLTWWPLARDSTYYIVSLCILAIFFGINNRGEDNNGDGKTTTRSSGTRP